MDTHSGPDASPSPDGSARDGADSGYLDAVEALYREAADVPQPALCCTQSPVWELPGLVVPAAMLERNYGCGSTVSPRDLARAKRVLYVGVGAGMEALQFAYFLRRPGGVVAVDTNAAMRALAGELLEDAASVNEWFTPAMVQVRAGDARALPLPDASVDVVAQNCLFNIFTRAHLAEALAEAHRVLAPHGKLVLSDPVAERPIPAHLAADDRLRAACLSGALPLSEYLAALVDAGFGTLEVRARRPYRVLDATRYGLEDNLLLEAVEVVAIKDPVTADGPCIFTGRTAIYVGDEDTLDDGRGHVLLRDLPLGVCDKTASALEGLGRADLIVTKSTWHYPGDGCC